MMQMEMKKLKIFIQEWWRYFFWAIQIAENLI